MQPGVGDEVDLDSGVATRIVDGAGVDLGDRHRDGSRSLYSPLNVSK